jgi:hypothetical protein
MCYPLDASGTIFEINEFPALSILQHRPYRLLTVLALINVEGNI